MPPRTRGLIYDVMAFAVVLLVSCGPARVWCQARSAAWAELPLPPIWVHGTLLGAGAAALFAGVVLFAIKADPEHKGFRLAPMAAVVAVFVRAFVLTSFDSPAGAEGAVARDFSIFRDAVLETAARSGALPGAEADLVGALERLDAPPYLSNGSRVPRYRVAVRSPCEAPLLDAAGHAPGSFLYCVAADRKSAWLTVVGLSGEVGSPEMLGRRLFGEPIRVRLRPYNSGQ